MDFNEYIDMINHFIQLSEQYISDYEKLKVRQNNSHISYICGYLASAIDLNYHDDTISPEYITELIGKLALISE